MFYVTKNMKNKVKIVLDKFMVCLSQRSTNKHYKRIMKLTSIENKHVEGEEEWIERWSQFGFKASPIQFRVFSHYIGNDIDIVPEEISHRYIETVLNPTRYRGYYADKNVFDKLFPTGFFPKTILRKIDGLYFDTEYKRLYLNDDIFNEILKGAGSEKVILKPSVEGISGRGVQMFTKNNAYIDWSNSKGEKLTLELLNKYGKNLIIQEAVNQSEYISQFNQSSVNTLRLSVYRSVIDEEPHVTGAIMRIGGSGSIVDNAHAGGCYVGIKPDGSFCHEVMNQYGERRKVFNNISFENEYRYPNWDEVILFAKSVSQYIPHHRLLALDIVLDKDNHPHLIEFNIEGYSTWLFQFTVGPAFGCYTDEIIRYCRDNQPKLMLKIVER